MRSNTFEIETMSIHVCITNQRSNIRAPVDRGVIQELLSSAWGGGGGVEPLSKSRFTRSPISLKMPTSAVYTFVFPASFRAQDLVAVCFRLAISADKKARTFQFSLNWRGRQKDSSFYNTVNQITIRFGRLPLFDHLRQSMGGRVARGQCAASSLNAVWKIVD